MIHSFLLEGSIKEFFEGDDSLIPTSELQYLHTHPLITPNFVTQINDLVNSTSKVILERGITGKPIETLTNLAVTMGKALSDPLLSKENSEVILFELRKLYKLCLEINKIGQNR